MVQSGRTPFADISNAIGTGTQDTPNTTPVALHQIERKRQRERERYAGMSAEQKDEKNKKHREALLMKKTQQAQCNETKHPGVQDEILATGIDVRSIDG
ncbi:uncharacterized protein C2845_PM11G26600 [Panicum miliaceum]|uniref:Uncharacterized protein n=1 Tax=Panicum miliaceum TaxID=4540 RepID=A0A3L6RTS5_PANMI|nr:uncharacterized protein C2845_PM11G26600 [Panicum miliaceum]